MAGGIDIHTHIGGGKMTIARMLLPEDHAAHPVASGRITRSGSGLATPSTITTGYRYAEMGYNEARTRENQNPQNELLEAQDGKRLDTRTTSTTVGPDPALETVGTVNGAENDGR